MKKLFNSANRLLENTSLQDWALIKFCLCALGIMIGLSVPLKKKKAFLIGSSVAFTATYIPLMIKFLPLVFKKTLEYEDE